MIRILVNQLVEGQILAQDVIRDDGVVLMTQGLEITSEAISLLSRLDIDSVSIEGDEFASDEERWQWLAEQENALNQRFAKVKNDKVLVAIRELFRRRLRLRVGLEPGAPPPHNAQGGAGEGA